MSEVDASEEEDVEYESREDRPQKLELTMEQAQNLFSGGLRSGVGPRRVGFQYSGERDVYSALGYKDINQLTYEDYKQRYQRQDIASAIIDSKPESTWKEAPQIKADNSDFEREVHLLLDGDNARTSLRYGLLHHFEVVDRLARLGEYASLFLGFSDAGRDELKEPVEGLSNLNDLLYVTAMKQPAVDWDEDDIIEDPSSRRFGWPKYYRMDFEGMRGDVKVHHSRVVHIPENVFDNHLRGEPVLRACYNRLFDIEKTLGASAEVVWRAGYPGLHVDIPPELHGMVDEDDLDKQVDEYEHDMRRTLKTYGSDVEMLEGQSIDPSPVIDSELDMISGTLGIPQRKLIGTEQGDLASSQDQATWFSRIHSRQTEWAEPVVVRPTIRKLKNAGVLSTSESYEVVWPNLFELTELEEADLKANLGLALKRASPRGDPGTLATPEEIRKEIFGWSPDIGSEVDGDTQQVSGQPDNGQGDSGMSSEVDELLRRVGEAGIDVGDIVRSPSGVGVVAGEIRSNFMFPETNEESGDEGLTEIEATQDRPAYVVGYVGKAAVYRASDLNVLDVDGPDELREVDKSASDGSDPIAVITGPGFNDDDWAEGWDKWSLMAFYADAGGDFDNIVREMTDEFDWSENFANRMAGQAKDQLLGTKRWRDRF